MTHYQNSNGARRWLAMISVLVFFILAESVYPKPQAVKIKSSVSGYIETGVQTPVDVFIQPLYPCDSMKVNFRALENIELTGNLEIRLANCANIKKSIYVSLPKDSTGYLVVDVEYTGKTGRYGSSTSIRFTTIQPGQNKFNQKPEYENRPGIRKDKNRNIKILPVD